jgi:hypothetical protein
LLRPWCPGCHLVRDAFRGSYDAAVLLSNGTDLVEPIRIVTQELRLPAGLIAPEPKPAAGLKAAVSFVPTSA